jgi:hypothetical protein
MAAYNLILLDCGDVMLSEVHTDQERAQASLCEWIGENWHDEDSDPGDFSMQDMIEYFFDHHEDYRWYMQPVHLPKQAAAGEILLTPGMCAIVRNGLAQVANEQARDLLRDHDELDMDGDQYQQTSNTIGEMLDVFE